MIHLPVDMTFTRQNKLYAVPHSDGTVEIRRGDVSEKLFAMDCDAAEETALWILREVEQARSLKKRMET